MLRTYYAGGRASLPAPAVTVSTGTMNGGGSTYYVWLIARNRVGYNLPSAATSVVIGAGKSLVISSANFTALAHEDWHRYAIAISTSNSYSSARIIYEKDVYLNGVRLPSIAVTLDTQAVLNTTYSVATPINLPSGTSIPEGYRVIVTALNNTYRYSTGNTSLVDGLTVLSAGAILNARWVLVTSGSVIESVANHDKELFQVTDSDLIEANIPASTAVSESVVYYIKNTNTDTINEGEIDLNIYQSDKSLRVGAKIEVLGYLDMSTYVLDTTGIPYVGSLIAYPGDTVELTKPLPVNSSLVFKVLLDIDSNQSVIPGTSIALYPRINSYITVDKVDDWGESVASISVLKALPQSVIKDGQSIHVASVNKIYSYNAASTLTVDGDSVLRPNFNPATGRWLSISSTVLDASITTSKLAPGVLAMLDDKLENTSQILNSSTTFILDFAVTQEDYFILTTPPNDNNTTIINFQHATLSNGSTASKLLELVQRDGELAFHSSILFPGGNVPALSGNGKTDLLLLTIRKDTAGGVKKRAVLLQKNIG